MPAYCTIILLLAYAILYFALSHKLKKVKHVIGKVIYVSFIQSVLVAIKDFTV